MNLKHIISAIAASCALVGCVSPDGQSQAKTSLVAMKNAVVPAGVPCGHLEEASATGVAGCEGYIPLKRLSAGEQAQIADLNTRFAQDVSPIVNFAFNKYDLTAQSHAILDAQAAWMSQHGQIRFTVYGHTDLVGSEGYNFDLAKKRAEQVVGYLASRGVDSAQLEALVSYGETRPIVSTTLPEGQNRRTVTEVSGFVTVPVLRTTAPVSCQVIAPKYLASYPVCIDEEHPYTPPSPPPAPPAVIPLETATAETDDGTTSTYTQASYTDDGTTVTRDANARAGTTSTGVTRTDNDDGSWSVEVRGPNGTQTYSGSTPLP